MWVSKHIIDFSSWNPEGIFTKGIDGFVAGFGDFVIDVDLRDDRPQIPLTQCLVTARTFRSSMWMTPLSLDAPTFANNKIRAGQLDNAIFLGYCVFGPKAFPNDLTNEHIVIRSEGLPLLAMIICHPSIGKKAFSAWAAYQNLDFHDNESSTHK